MNYLLHFIQGIIMGLAEIVPGVGGSTLAISMGIYERFIQALHGFSELARSSIYFLFGRVKKSELKNALALVDWKFTLPLAVGAVLAIALFSNVVSVLLTDYRQYIFAFFFGIILASLFIPLSEMKVITWDHAGIFLATFVVFYMILGIPEPSGTSEVGAFSLFAGAFLAISAIVVPGISGSFILLLLGLYDYAIYLLRATLRLQVSTEEIVKLAAFVLGLAAGLAIFVKILKYFLENYHSALMAFSVGLMAASLRVLWPFETASSVDSYLLLILIALGVLIVGLVRIWEMIYSANANPH